jgi:hypothetical protein
MAYVSNNLSRLVGTFDGAFGIWVYKHTDAIATVRAANYISDAQAKGMKARDIVIVMDTSTPTTQFCTVLTVGANGADLCDGLAIAETNS